jgi:hypothetical protein
MIPVKNIIVSDELKDIKFCCDLARCKGGCCVEGDAGAPLEEEEISVLEDDIDNIKPYMTIRGRETVEGTGVFDYDSEGNFVTPLVNGVECAFTGFDEKGIAYCTIERAFDDGKTPLRKPVSCHLYPVRISGNGSFNAVNYHKWHICKPALKKGRQLDLPLYVFLEDSLVRKYGREWYNELVEKINNE